MADLLRDQINAYLEQTFLDGGIPPRLSEAMRYSLLAGGKRLRPALFLRFARACAPEKAEKVTGDLMPFAAGIEMVHTYSLIHDDLPAMDDDDLRRGRPTCHRAFGEATAILAGDALLTDAFGFMARAAAPAEDLLRALHSFADAAGSAGMAGGQELDLEAEGKRIPLEELIVLNAKKTGALLRCSCECGVLLGGGTSAQREASRIFGSEFGIAFQITDDILDVTGDAETVGKEVRHDAESGKATWPSLLGLEEARRLAIAHCSNAAAALDGAFPPGRDADLLRAAAQSLADRTH
ncbi:MAG: polyprenyl synthetase family protein [Desulfovibrio sp.]|jgi:geranylgeranyl diphosphate synthase type II